MSQVTKEPADLENKNAGEPKKVKKNRRSYLNDYKQENDESGKSRYVYTGKVYSLKLSPDENSAYRIRFALLTLLSVSAYVFCGFSNAEVTRVLYISLPLSVIFLPLFFTVLSVWTIASGKTSYEEKAFERTVMRLKFTSTLTVVCALFCVVGTFSYSIMSGSIREIPVIFVTFCAAIAVLQYFVMNYSRKYRDEFSNTK